VSLNDEFASDPPFVYLSSILRPKTDLFRSNDLFWNRGPRISNTLGRPQDRICSQAAKPYEPSPLKFSHCLSITNSILVCCVHL
jgi:hypothetical protein